MRAIWILALLVIVLANAIGAMLMRSAAIQKGYGDGTHAWAICFWLGIFGYLYIIALPDKISQNQNQQIINLLKENGK